MVDAHHVPPELQNLLMILVGNRWPTGDEAALRAEAAVWRQAAEAMRSCTDRLLVVQRLVHQGLTGRTHQAFDDYMTQLVGKGQDDESAILPVLARCCDSAADSLAELANEIQTLRVTIIGCLVVLWAQLMIDLTVLFFLGGVARAAAAIAAARSVMLLLLRRAITTVVTRVAESVLAQVGFTLLAQVIQLVEGHRQSLNGAQLRTAAINGAVGGAVGVGAGFVGGVLRAGAGKLVGNVVLSPVGRVTVDVVWGAGYGALAGMAEGAAQDAVFGLSGDWIAGAANGAFNGAWGGRHTAMNPGNRLSMSPADHLEGALDRYFDGSTHTKPPTGSSEGKTGGVSSSTGSRSDGPRLSEGGEGREVRQDSRMSNGNELRDLPPVSVPRHLPVELESNPWSGAVERDSFGFFVRDQTPAGTQPLPVVPGNRPRGDVPGDRDQVGSLRSLPPVGTHRPLPTDLENDPWRDQSGDDDLPGVLHDPPLVDVAASTHRPLPAELVSNPWIDPTDTTSPVSYRSEDR
ncbi:hypothetical protein GCM10027290_05520 [Micromonospora sonneratiae]|uniref:Outer membrane channel protein CpnT-like N-terminal domain-containing protein n=1 Tax=Micromonospora sonneratiae TaxID=1184706 RepID=A0ABW3YM91_9ACTN